MGSSASKSSVSERTFSPRRIVLVAAAALSFLVLAFVAGGSAMLPHNNGVVVFIADLNTAVPSPAAPRKMLRDGGCGSPTKRRQSRPELLPRGVVHETTNLEMEASLAGNPERRKPPTKTKSLLAVPVGIKNKAGVERLVSKFPADEFTVMLFHYDGAVEQWSGGDLEQRSVVHVAARGQTKWWFAKRFLHPDVVADYEYVFLWDEDVEVDNFDPVRYLAVVRREGLEVSQPALGRASSEIHHALTVRRAGPLVADFHRGEGWVEGMVPVFSRTAWRCVWGMVQNDLIHAWGLDFQLGYCAGGDRARSVGVVDSEYVLHQGVPVLGGGGGSGGSAGRAAVRYRSFKEMQIFERRWNAAAAEDESWTDPYAAQPSALSSTG